MELRGDLATDVGPAAGAATLTISEAFRLFDRLAGHGPGTDRLPTFGQLAQPLPAAFAKRNR